MRETVRLPIDDPSQTGMARRRAALMGREFGFDELQIEHVSIVVTELATNLVKHAGGGDLILRILPDDAGSGMDILSLDKGCGIGNVVESMRDGYSTSGSPGSGLGAIRRLSAHFDLYTRPGMGTAILSRIRGHMSPQPETKARMEIGVVCLPVPTEEDSGDAWAVHHDEERTRIMIADGLGHGRYAAEAASAAKAIFMQHPSMLPSQLLGCIHHALRVTRGAAVSVTEVPHARSTVRHAGVGNISGRIVSESKEQHLLSHNGTAGLDVRRIEEMEYPWPEDAILILHSDGLTARWNMDDYPGLRERNPALIAGVLFRDHARIRDDNTVAVIRQRKNWQ